MGDWLVGLLCSGLIAWVALQRRSLSISGAFAALIVGTILYAMGSLAWFGSMIFFFVSSSFLTKWKHAAKAIVESTYEKTGQRDAGQVMANGALAALFCMAHEWTAQPEWIYLFLGVMATVTADTWATEIGGQSRQKPVSVVSWKVVEPGTSGGVTLLGLLASACGGASIGLLVWLFAWMSGDTQVTEAGPIWLWLMLGLVGGLAGSLADSALGALWQRKNRCHVCGKEMESSQHCGQRTSHARGLGWLGNDGVNLISSVFGGMVTLLLFVLYQS